MMGLTYLELGDLQHAESWRDRALALAVDFVPDIVVAIHAYRGEDEEALAYANKDLESDRGNLRSLRVIRDHEVRNGNLAEARIRFEQAYPELFDATALNIGRDNRETAVDLAYLLLQTGEQAQAEHLLDQSEAAIALGHRITTIEVFAVLEARIHALRGDKANAIAALRQAVNQGWRWQAWYFLEHDPVLAPLHAEPEFQSIKAVVTADMAEQLTRVRKWEANGELPPAPATIPEPRKR
jgi:tetratricopeptide (TPR) repeat protein